MIALSQINLVNLLIIHFICVKLLWLSVAFNIGTSHLFCSAKQMTGFYMTRNTRLKWVNSYREQYFLSSEVYLGPCKTSMIEIFFLKFCR